VRLGSDIEYYDVPGTTIDEVIDRLNGLRLEGPGAPPSQGLTRYHILPEWRAVPSGGACRVERLSLRVDITVTLPRWPGLEDRPASERERWRVIDDAIRAHEYRHHEIVVAVAEELAETLRGMQARGCGNLERAVESALSVADGRLREAHAQLDRETPSRLTTGGTGR
jgi:predicted secreted Zn-dependent protease